MTPNCDHQKLPLTTTQTLLQLYIPINYNFHLNFIYYINIPQGIFISHNISLHMATVKPNPYNPKRSLVQIQVWYWRTLLFLHYDIIKSLRSKLLTSSTKKLALCRPYYLPNIFIMSNSSPKKYLNLHSSIFIIPDTGVLTPRLPYSSLIRKLGIS